jgi:hypothetical protein
MYAEKKIFNILPCTLTGYMSERIQFKAALTRYLNTHSFYIVRFEALSAVLLRIHISWDVSLSCRMSDS